MRMMREARRTATAVVDSMLPWCVGVPLWTLDGKQASVERDDLDFKLTIQTHKRSFTSTTISRAQAIDMIATRTLAESLAK